MVWEWDYSLPCSGGVSEDGLGMRLQPTLFRGCEWSRMYVVSCVVDLTVRELSHVPHVNSKLEWAGDEFWKNEAFSSVRTSSPFPIHTIFSGVRSTMAECTGSRSGGLGLPRKSQSELDVPSFTRCRKMCLQKYGEVTWELKTIQISVSLKVSRIWPIWQSHSLVTQAMTTGKLD